MPKVTRDRGERYGGGLGGQRSSYFAKGGDHENSSFQPKSKTDGLNKTVMGSLPPHFATSTPLVKKNFPSFEANLSPLINAGTPISKPREHGQPPISSGFFQFGKRNDNGSTFNSVNSDLFKIPKVQILPQIKEDMNASTTPALSTRTIPVSNTSKKDEAAEVALMKANVQMLNKKFVADIVKKLKVDNSVCLIPSACQYLIQSINIVSRVHLRPEILNLTKLMRDIEEQVNGVNDKVSEAKKKVKSFRKSDKDRKPLTEKSTTNKKVTEPMVTATSTWTTGAGALDNRKRDREESTSPLPMNFKAFNGGSSNPATSLKRSRDDKPFSTSPPTKPVGSLCNGLSPQPGMNFKFDITKPFKPLDGIKTSPPSTSKPEAHPPAVGSTFTFKSPVNSLNKSPQGFGFGGGVDMNHKQTKGLEQKPAAGFFSSGSSGSSSIFPPFSTTNNSTDHKPTGFGGGNMESVFNSFAAVKPPEPTPAASNSAEDDEDAEPPKYEFVPVVEETALFSKRCKLFEKKEGSFKDRGIGVLYINEVKTDKFQVVIRADNSLGTVLLNMMLNSELPVQKSGKNNVLTVDPTADAGKGVPILIRVKTGEDADELIGKLNEFKAKSS